jgi:hypothetical protein
VRSSVRFARFIIYPCLVGDPIYFPSFPTIFRERLFEVGRIRVGLRPDKSNQDGFAIRAGWFSVVELPASILEFAYRGRTQGAALAGGPIEAPLVCMRIVQAQGQTFDVSAGRAVGFNSSRLARPSQTFRVTEVPSNSTHVVEPVKG